MKQIKIDREYLYKLNNKTNQWDCYQNETLLPKHPKVLYKYYSLNLNNIDALYRNYFFLSNPKEFNDPFDCNLNLIEDLQLYEKNKININNFGICSFSETIDNHLMWAHYTNNYHGFALGFKERIQIDENKRDIQRYSLGRVIYPEKVVKMKSDNPISLYYVLTTKYQQWKYEKEWRILAELKDYRRELKFSPESLEAIYVGHKIPDNKLNIYAMLLKIQEERYPDAKVYVVYPHPTELKLEFELQPG